MAWSYLELSTSWQVIGFYFILLTLIGVTTISVDYNIL